MAVRLINAAPELKALIWSPQLTVVDFFAQWCGPCQNIAPQLHDLAMANPHVNFCKVDVDKCRDLAAEYQVRAMPTFVYCRAGQVVQRVEGADIHSVARYVEQFGVKVTPTIPNDEELSKMSARQLLKLMADLSISSVGLPEKQDLMEALRQHRK